MPALDPYEIIDVYAEEKPNQNGTIVSTYDVVVKYVHKIGLDEDLDEDNECEIVKWGWIEGFHAGTVSDNHITTLDVVM